MKKLAKISAVLFTMVFGLMLMFHEACETLDQQFIAPSVASNLEKHDFKFVDQKYCSAIASNPRARYACELFKADSIDSHRIRQVVGDGYQFKKLLLMKDYIPEESGESDLFWPISLFASNSYDAYSMEYSSEYREDWDYSVFNLVENYRIFSARLATAIFTTRYSEDNVVIRDDEIFIVSTSENLLIVRRIYQQYEEGHVFSL